MTASDDRWGRLYYKYSHVGCPAAHMEDNCAQPDRCADTGRCIDLGPPPEFPSNAEQLKKT